MLQMQGLNVSKNTRKQVLKGERQTSLDRGPYHGGGVLSRVHLSLRIWFLPSCLLNWIKKCILCFYCLRTCGTWPQFCIAIRSKVFYLMWEFSNKTKHSRCSLNKGRSTIAPSAGRDQSFASTPDWSSEEGPDRGATLGVGQPCTAPWSTLCDSAGSRGRCGWGWWCCPWSLGWCDVGTALQGPQKNHTVSH